MKMRAEVNTLQSSAVNLHNPGGRIDKESGEDCISSQDPSRRDFGPLIRGI